MTDRRSWQVKTANVTTPIDAHFSSLPPETLQQGLFKFARAPPSDDRFLTTRIYRHFGFGSDTTVALTPKHDQKVGADIRVLIDGMEREANSPTSHVTWEEAEDASNIVIQRKVPHQWGKWRVMPPEIGTNSK